MHGIAFAATGGTKVRSAFAVARWIHTVAVRFDPHVQQDVLNQLGSGIVLRIPAEDFFFAARRVGKEDEVANHIQQARRLKHALNQAVQRVDAVGFDQITTVGLSPRVEKLVRCKKGSGFVVDTIADHAKRVVLEQSGMSRR